MEFQSVTGRTVAVAGGVFAPGHLGELTQVLDFELVDAVARETGAVQKRVRLLPTRVVIYFVLALALFEDCGYRQVWGKLAAGLGGLGLVWPSASGLTRARRRVGPEPFRALFEAVAGVVACPKATPQAFWRGLRLVAIDATYLQLADDPAITAVHPKRRGDKVTWGYPLLRLTVLIEVGTRALIGAVFGPESDGEKTWAARTTHLLTAQMLLLADAGYDSIGLLTRFAGSGAQVLCRSSAGRTPPIQQVLPDGSYLSTLYGRSHHHRLPVRVVEAWITVTWAGGAVHQHQWRLITTLLDHTRHPATELAELYHQRWEIETAYRTIKSTILDGKVLRSRRAAGADQEIWALLTVYQTIVRITVDAVTTEPGLDPDRISFTVALHTARDQVTTAGSIFASSHPLLDAIGRAVLASLLPARRKRAKARWRKNPTSKYSNITKYPYHATGYTLHTEISIMANGLTPRTKP